MKLVIDGPNEKQALFLLDKHKYIAYGGARGGGKSWAVRTKAKLMALRYPGIRLLIVRRSYPELINNHINTLRKELLGIEVQRQGQGAAVYQRVDDQLHLLRPGPGSRPAAGRGVRRDFSG